MLATYALASMCSPFSIRSASRSGLLCPRLQCKDASFYTFSAFLTTAYSVELGYAPNAIEKKVVNLLEGENFAPEFVKIVRVLNSPPSKPDYPHPGFRILMLLFPH